MGAGRRGIAPRRLRRTTAALFLFVVGLALFASAPASALIHRGHVFSFSIEGEKTEKLSKPSGVAVNEATGEVYVVDTGNNRIERFSASGEFIAAWGWGVTDEKPEYEVCTSLCKPGLPGSGLAQFESPESIAIDNSGGGESQGDVYVASNRVSVNAFIEKFSSTGESLGRLNTEGLSGVGGLAVDSTGILWVWDNEAGVIGSFDNKAPNKQRPAAHLEEEVGLDCGVPGFGVDAVGEALYINHQQLNFETECPEGAPSEKNPALIAKLKLQGEPPVGVPLIEGLDDENSTGVAVDTSTGQQASGDVYVDNATSIAAFTSSGALIQRFGGEAGLTKGRGVAVDAQRERVLVAGSSTGRVVVFGPAPAGAPQVDSVTATNLTPTSTRLEAEVDANGIDTHYFFQYGTADCKASPASCTSVPAPPGADIGSGFGDVHVEATVTGLEPGTEYFVRVVAENEKGEQAEGAQTVNTFTTLPNGKGILPDGREWELVSPPEKGGSGIEAIGGSGGPAGGIMESSEDGSAVTYVADGPIEPEPEGNRSPEGTQVFSRRGSDAWSSKSIVTPNRKGEGFPAGKPQEYQLFSSDLTYGLVVPFAFENPMQEPPLVPGAVEEERGIYRRSNFTCDSEPATCYQPLITAENNTAHAEFGGVVGTGNLFGGGVLNGTANLDHIVFQSEVALTGPKPKPSEEVPRLYEWSAASPPVEQLKLVSVLPNGKPAKRPALGHALTVGSDVRNAISADGSRVFWTETEEGPSENIKSLYVRDTAKGETLKLNDPVGGVKVTKAEQEEVEEVSFQSASADGSRVFFTDTVALTPQSRLKATIEGPADLYECDLSEVEGKLSCDLRDLTVAPASQFGETADVVGLTLGTSTDGSSIYFVANGVISDDAISRGAKHGDCPRPTTAQTASQGAECNLYREHFNSETETWEEPQFIAALSQEDAPDWGRTGTASLRRMTSRVSPNGRYLAFMSNRSLTGYDNVDVSPAAEGARDEEVFLYDANTRRLVCASCNPGSKPHGVLDTIRAGEGLGLVVDRQGSWRDVSTRWLAGTIPGWTPLEPNSAPYQSRYLDDSGRLYFNANDQLVEQDKNEKMDVYQFEPSGAGGCAESAGCVSLISSGISKNESAFIDASVSGNDVFFVTSAQLISSDRDHSFDLYDARVCSDSSPCIKPPPPPPAPCADEASCRPPAPAPPVFGGSGTAGFSGPGNVAKEETLGQKPTTVKPKPLTKAQKLAKALSSCRKKFKHAKKKRVACEKQARKKFGAHKAKKKAAKKK
ncbi:MAG TPA: hypothetical protein VN672_03830 [Solirubrobacteraceae bacterium]|nr:hypothetical protein [Solirubrobacteraceae bacterium]